MNTKLFINNLEKFPHLENEIDYENNIKNNIDINKISIYSNKVVYWKCQNVHKYKIRLCNRTKYGTGCKECVIDSRRIHDKHKIELLRNSTRIIKESVFIGDNTENYIEDLLIKTSLYKNVEKLGEIGGSGDICITHHNDAINYIQIKTLVKDKRCKDTYNVLNNKKYEDNMLIVMVNKERTHFGLTFFEDIKELKSLSLTFNSKSKYKNIIYNDVEIFLENLIKLIPKSTKNNIISKTTNMETESLNRFKKYCMKNNIIFNRNKTNGNTIDGIINSFTFQAKYTNFNVKNGQTYHINSIKSSGRLNGKDIKKPYEIKDFDFMIIEIGGTKIDPDMYNGNFCIIPFEVLIKQNIIKTDTCKGKYSFHICPPDYKKEHWSKLYWNNIKQII